MDGEAPDWRMSHLAGSLHRSFVLGAPFGCNLALMVTNVVNEPGRASAIGHPAPTDDGFMGERSNME